MNTPTGRIRAILVLAISLIVSSGADAESPGQAPAGVKSEPYFLDQAPAFSAFRFAVVVMRDVGWSEAEVARVLREASRIYLQECRFSLEVEGIHYIEVDARVHHLDRMLQEQLLAELDEIGRPTVFFIGATSGDDVAYAYLQGTASPSQGTAWLSRQAAKECRAPLLAHEIGHIALEATRHSGQPGNLMGDSCRFSNIGNHSINTDLNQRQCRTLWHRYGQ